MDSKHRCLKKNEQLDLRDLKCEQDNFKNSCDFNTTWLTNDLEKTDLNKRWSYGSDTSIEPVERIQNRLCCSPVDFDSSGGSENEELIVNSLESDETFKNYISIKVSPSCSPTFKKNVFSSSSRKKRNKSQDVDTADDELIDYSKIYVTEKDYAETDLDQPTDYSLRYPDEEDRKDSQFYCTNLPDDTVKTYNTEGTPNNFSNATSMTDLLAFEDSKENLEGSSKCCSSKEQKKNKIEKTEKVIIVKNYKKELRKKNCIDSKITVLKETNKLQVKKSEKDCKNSSQFPVEPVQNEKSTKAVTFKKDESYAQETPLMFSRCSSLDSLSDFDQHSIHDDHSSIISDLSHRTSRAVSPSDLPDSPSQTVPPSPTKLSPQNKQNLHQKPSQRNGFNMPNSKSDIKGIKNLKKEPEPLDKKHKKINDRNNDFFDDSLVTFERESLMSGKAHSTTGSVLSSLTIEDDTASIYDCDNRDIINRIAAIRVRTSAAGMHQAPTQKLPYDSLLNESEKSIQSHQLQKIFNRHSGCMNNLLLPSIRDDVYFFNVEHNHDYNTTYEIKEANVTYGNSPNNYFQENDMKNENYSQLTKISNSGFIRKRNEFNFSQRINNDDLIITDTLRIYCTEDTPTFTSPFSSQSNLSALSMLSISDDDSNFQDHYSFGYEKRTNSRNNSGSTTSNSDLSDNDYSYDDDLPHQRRIDVSPFDSQMNLANMSLLCIEEEEEEEADDEQKGNSKENSILEKNYETDYLSRDRTNVEDENENINFSK